MASSIFSNETHQDRFETEDVVFLGQQTIQLVFCERRAGLLGTQFKNNGQTGHLSSPLGLSPAMEPTCTDEILWELFCFSRAKEIREPVDRITGRPRHRWCRAPAVAFPVLDTVDIDHIQQRKGHKSHIPKTVPSIATTDWTIYVDMFRSFTTSGRWSTSRSEQVPYSIK